MGRIHFCVRPISHNPIIKEDIMKLGFFCCKSQNMKKRILIAGAVFPLCATLVMLSAPWVENYRILRMMGCYLPLPIFMLVLVLTQLFLSLSFFLCTGLTDCFCSISAYNARVFVLSAAFMLEIWFCMEFCVISPFIAALCVLAALCFALLGAYVLARRGKLLCLLCLAAAVLITALLVMNIKVLFV